MDIFAVSPGFRNGAQATSVPRRTLDVRAAMAARAVKGSGEPATRPGRPYRPRSRKKWSEIQTESKPSASARTAASSRRSQVTGCPSGNDPS